MTLMGSLPMLLAIPVLYKVIAFLVRRKLRATLTAVDDLPLLSKPRKTGRKIKGTAVICGRSIGGMLSARVCSDHFENVIIIEPEAWLATEEGLTDRHRAGSSAGPPFQNRSRVPQYKALHAYQAFTPIALRRLFPDFDREIHRRGARILPFDNHLHISGKPLPVPHHLYPEGLPGSMFISRPGYETALRQLLLTTCDNVKYVTGSVTALSQHSSSTNSVASVLMRSLAGEETDIPATLVVDCTGKALGGLRWLQDFPVPAESQTKTDSSLPLCDLKVSYDPKLGYTSCEFDVPPRIFDTLKENGFPYDYETAGFLYIHAPDAKIDRRSMVIMRREHNFLEFAAGGWGINQSSRLTCVSDLISFISDINSAVPIPAWITSMLDIFEQEKVPGTYRYDGSPPPVYVQYHRARSLPSNFIALGDSVLQLNPVRGQGCTKACVEAVTLNALLARCVPIHSPQRHEDLLPDDFSRTFFAAQAKRTGHLWATTKILDYAQDSTVPQLGEDRKSFGAWRRAFLAQVMQLALKDRDVAAVFFHTGNWLVPTTDLFSPQILLKIAWMRIRGSLGL